MTQRKAPIISAAELKVFLESDNAVVLDASITPVGSSSQNVSLCIPGSIRFDFDREICDSSSALPHMLPSPLQFAQQVSQLGISNDSDIVVYDNTGVYSSPRAWWMFKVMGHREVRVLNGGLPAWINAGFEIQQEHTIPKARGNFHSSFQKNLLSQWEEVEIALEDSNFVVMDARSAQRFSGLEAEPRANLQCGHMPGALNVPFPEVLSKGMMKPQNELVEIFSMYKNIRIIATCGSGVTACILALALEIAGHFNWSVYDGSWAEWGRVDSKRKIVTR